MVFPLYGRQFLFLPNLKPHILSHITPVDGSRNLLSTISSNQITLFFRALEHTHVEEETSDTRLRLLKVCFPIITLSQKVPRAPSISSSPVLRHAVKTSSLSRLDRRRCRLILTLSLLGKTLVWVLSVTPGAET
ncbi:hypothetical protein CEXT_9701 [Caerostris extrusa]|uniref:Uncharacterized protein n=1 Tax=Caerostris extrusa TaxID=172846 RepID=A0AAV4THS7_CAEEX|nr:hypothetical protein CEXT_9701 [Caerostris extrusa]